MKRYVLDTNLYVRAFREDEAATNLEVFYAIWTPGTFLSSIVVFELLTGASSPQKAKQIRDEIVAPFVRVGRLITPGYHAWEDSGRAIATMARKEKRDLRTVPRSLFNDFLLAASCRDTGTTLITDNTTDFRLVRRYLRFEFEPPWPG